MRKARAKPTTRNPHRASKPRQTAMSARGEIEKPILSRGRRLSGSARTPSKPARTATPKPPNKTSHRSEPSTPSTSIPEAAETSAPASDGNGFCIVGIGASAGGLEALEAFFQHTPPDLGVAFVIVQHLDRGHKSIMVDLLARRTSMKVAQVEDGTLVLPNHVYIIPPNNHLALLHGTLHLIPPDPQYPFRLPIDFFFRSLAEDKGDKSICIVLSGTGTDGALGLKAIKAAGGMTMAQEERTAKFDSMPHHAIATGCVDRILPVDQMPGELIKYLRHPYVSRPGHSKLQTPEPGTDGDMEKVFIALRAHTGHDFSQYKRSTTGRRIERRMAVHQITRLGEYFRYLQHNRAEIDALFQELLIGVTSFFRDHEAFEALAKDVIPRLFEHKPPENPIRIWVAGCSTGEEAYSVAILAKETADRLSKPHKVQIFGTDIDQHSLDAARVGLYPESIAADVSPERLKQCFTKEGISCRVRQPYRDMVLFAKHDLLRDPPFSKLDLIVCRNLLIYLNSALQRRVLPLFHYTLNPGGFLMLGPSETVAESSDLFALVDKKWKIFRRKQAVGVKADLPAMPLVKIGADQITKPRAAEPAVVHDIDKVLLDAYAPPCVIINDMYDVVHVRGRTGRYLEPAPGEASLNILKMARDGLRIPLRTALNKAFKDRTTVVHPKVRVQSNGSTRLINLMIRPLEGLMLVIFEDITSRNRAEIQGERPKSISRVDQHVAELERELNTTKASLQSTVEELETSGEELKSTIEDRII